MVRWLFTLVAVLSVCLPGTFALTEEPETETPKAEGIVLFDEQIEPVLVQH